MKHILKTMTLVIGLLACGVSYAEIKTVVTEGSTTACYSQETARYLARREAKNNAHWACRELGKGWNDGGVNFAGYEQCTPCGKSGEVNCTVKQAIYNCVNMQKENEEKAAKARAEKEAAAKEAKEKAEQARAEKAAAAKEKAEREKAEREAQQKIAQEKAARARAEKEAAAREAKEKAERERTEKAAAPREAREKENREREEIAARAEQKKLEEAAQQAALAERQEAERQRQQAEAAKAKQEAEAAEAKRKEEEERKRKLAELPQGYVKQGGLTWMPVTPERKNWSAANSYCASFNGLGQSDWRLPTLDELYAWRDSKAWKDQLQDHGEYVTVWSDRNKYGHYMLGVKNSSGTGPTSSETTTIHVTCVR